MSVESLLRMATALSLNCDQVSVRRIYCDDAEHQWTVAVECSHPQQGRYVAGSGPDEVTAMKRLYADLVDRITKQAADHDAKANALRASLLPGTEAPK